MKDPGDSMIMEEFRKFANKMDLISHRRLLKSYFCDEYQVDFNKYFRCGGFYLYFLTNIFLMKHIHEDTRQPLLWIVIR